MASTDGDRVEKGGRHPGRKEDIELVEPDLKWQYELLPENA